jgi:hypothetical protein
MRRKIEVIEQRESRERLRADMAGRSVPRGGAE